MEDHERRIKLGFNRNVFNDDGKLKADGIIRYAMWVTGYGLVRIIHEFTYSSNYGTNWQTLSTPEVNSYSVLFYYMDSTCGYFGGANSYKTTNSGLNWTLLSCPGSGNFGGFVNGILSANSNFPPMMDFAVRNDSNIYRNNIMSNWMQVYAAPNRDISDM